VFAAIGAKVSMLGFAFLKHGSTKRGKARDRGLYPFGNPPMPTNKELYEAMQRQREREHEAAERDRRRSLLVSAALCLFWALLGLGCFGMALHTTDRATGEIYRGAAYIVTYGGVSFTLIRAYLKGEKRGDW
jgi:hypothetical protein